jgi:GMP synthase-like glutamine amidotransferase
MIRVGANMLGIQGHPEFSVSFEKELIRINAPLMAPGQAEEELESLNRPVHNETVAAWMDIFLKTRI